MAMRLAFDLALHVDMSPYVMTGAISADEEALRRTVFWGAYTVELYVLQLLNGLLLIVYSYWGYYLGRSFRVNMDDVSVGKPNFDLVSREASLWTPYVSARSKETSSTMLDHTEEVSRQRILLCEIMAPLGHILYGAIEMPLDHS